MLTNPLHSFRAFVFWLGLISALIVGGLWALLLASPRPAPAQAEVVDAITRSPRALSSGPTRVARLIPSATPAPTDTPVPTPTATDPPTQTPTRTPTRRPTLVPSPVITQAPTIAAKANAAPAPAPPTSVPASEVAGPFFSRQSYATLGVNSESIDRPAAGHPDLNLAIRSFVPAPKEFAGLVDYDGATDGGAPQLDGLFENHRTPVIRAAYRVNDWDWGCNCRGDPITDWPVTLIGIETQPGEIILAPDAETDIGGGRVAMVLYADEYRITLKYTREDSVAHGYTIHVDGILVPSELLDVYRMANGNGRGELPVLRPFQAIGAARTGEIKVAIRDSGAFLDPRSRKDWWHGH